MPTVWQSVATTSSWWPRNEERLKSLSARLKSETGRSVKALLADLGDRPALAKIEAMLRGDPSIAMLVNNAGTASVAPLLSADVDKMEDMIALNVTALTRLTMPWCRLSSRGAQERSSTLRR